LAYKNPAPAITRSVNFGGTWPTLVNVEMGQLKNLKLVAPLL